MQRCVILAAGRGARMRNGTAPALTAAEARAADTGVKALVPVGRPFLDYVLHAVAEAGFREVCLVVGPDHGALRERYGTGLRRLRTSFAVQTEPKGTADALHQARSLVTGASSGDVSSGDEFAVLNSDTYYPPEVLRQLRALDGPGLVAFDRRRLLERGETNITHERLAAFAVVRESAGRLRGLVEKPDPATYAAFPEPVCVSLNCWRFSPRIFAACAAVPPSDRGELELTDAVLWSMDELGDEFRLAVSAAPVLDLTNRDDIAPVRERLAGLEVAL
jgi:glucose-1-phosphate thymidylyltransferase